MMSSVHTMCGQGSTQAEMGGVPETAVQPPGASQSGSSVAADRGITGRGYLTEAPMETSLYGPTNIAGVQRLKRSPPVRRWI